MGNRIIMLATGAALASGALAATASAGSSQAGCQAYGAFVANLAQTLNSQQPGGGGEFVSGIARTAPGALADTGTFLKSLTC